jgi:hypothetical protein
MSALSAILVPIVVAVAGFIIRQSMAKQTTAKDYVSLAIDILKVDPKIQDVYVGNPLREWAVDVLTLDSPVPISKAAQNQLRTTQVVLYEPWGKELPQGLERLQKGSATPTPKSSETP